MSSHCAGNGVNAQKRTILDIPNRVIQYENEAHSATKGSGVQLVRSAFGIALQFASVSSVTLRAGRDAQ